LFDIVVETGNIVAATFDIVERIVKLVAFDNVAWTMLLVWTGLMESVVRGHPQLSTHHLHVCSRVLNTGRQHWCVQLPCTGADVNLTAVQLWFVFFCFLLGLQYETIRQLLMDTFQQKPGAHFRTAVQYNIITRSRGVSVTAAPRYSCLDLLTCLLN